MIHCHIVLNQPQTIGTKGTKNRTAMQESEKMLTNHKYSTSIIMIIRIVKNSQNI